MRKYILIDLNNITKQVYKPIIYFIILFLIVKNNNLISLWIEDGGDGDCGHT
jgi:hypothetical protein